MLRTNMRYVNAQIKHNIAKKYKYLKIFILTSTFRQYFRFTLIMI